MMIYLQRIDADRNMRRFYRVSIMPTLFGEWAVIREWGRIGSPHGQRREQWFAERAPALMAVSKITAEKRRRGYSG